MLTTGVVRVIGRTEELNGIARNPILQRKVLEMQVWASINFCYRWRGCAAGQQRAVAIDRRRVGHRPVLNEDEIA